MIEQLKEKRNLLQKQIDAIDLVLLTFEDGTRNQNGQSITSDHNRSAAGQIGQTNEGVQAAHAEQTGAANEVIREGKSGDCTTTFVRANGSTEFKPASFKDV